jgi:hypothetical protein
MATVEEYQSIPIEDKLRRTAHHEAGHIVIAAQQGVPLRSEGISVDPLGEGLACYWKEPEANDSSRTSVIFATYAGFNAEEEFCRLHRLPLLEGLPIICSPDWVEARRLVSSLSGLRAATSVHEMDNRLREESRILVQTYWSAIEAVASALLAKEWEPLKELKSGGIWSQQTTARYLTGVELVLFLQNFGIEAVCRIN